MSIDFNVADIFKLPVKIFAAIALGTGLVLFLPDSVIEKLYLFQFRDSFGFVIGLVFVISVSVVGITALVALFKAVASKILFTKSKKSREKCLNNLDDYQKTIVYLLYNENNHTGELPLNDGSVRWLEQNLIIGKATTQHYISNIEDPEFPYLLQPWAIGYLNDHKELINEMKEASNRMRNTLSREYDSNGYM